MIVQCAICLTWFEDVYRNTQCPHETFLANDGTNNFSHHRNSYISDDPPSQGRIFEAHK